MKRVNAKETDNERVEEEDRGEGERREKMEDSTASLNVDHRGPTPDGGMGGLWQGIKGGVLGQCLFCRSWPDSASGCV